MENEQREEDRKIVVYGVISFVVIIFIILVINDIFLAQELSVSSQFCNDTGKSIHFNIDYGSYGNGHLEDGAPAYMAFFTDCK